MEHPNFQWDGKHLMGTLVFSPSIDCIPLPIEEGIVTYYSSDGSIHKTETYKDGFLEGPSTVYDSATKQTITHYEKGEWQWTKTYQKTRLVEEIIRTPDEHRVWSPKGVLLVEKTFQNGIQTSKYFYANGTLSYEHVCRQGEPVPDLRANYTKEGVCMERLTRTDQGAHLYEGWHPSGVKRYEYTQRNNVFEGPALSWYPEGTMRNESLHMNGILRLNRTGYRSGKLKWEKTFDEQGNPHGTHVFYKPDGSIKTTHIYVNGVKQPRVKPKKLNTTREDGAVATNHGDPSVLPRDHDLPDGH
jgi:antitoxin component YwqK of YwqJK toxin-antitoxin module